MECRVLEGRGKCSDYAVMNRRQYQGVTVFEQRKEALR